MSSSHSSAARRSSQRSSLTQTKELGEQLAQAQEAYRIVQANESDPDKLLQLSVHPGIPARKVSRSQVGARNGSGGADAAASYDARRRELSALTLDLIMKLTMDQILRLRNAFDAHGGVVTIAQFVAVMAAQLDMSKLNTTPDTLLCSLVELFDSMDLDGDGELEFEELLTTVVHMGLAATEHLLLTPISLYREGPQYLVSMNQVDRDVRFIPEREAIIVLDQGKFACRLYDPSMKRALAVELPLSSALSIEYVHGVLVDTQQQNSSYRRGNYNKASYYTSGKPSAKDEREKARKAAEALHATYHKQPKEIIPMWEKVLYQSPRFLFLISDECFLLLAHVLARIVSPCVVCCC
jgi:hypothetical protein